MRIRNTAMKWNNTKYNRKYRTVMYTDLPEVEGLAVLGGLAECEGEREDAAGAGTAYPVEQLGDGPARLLLHGGQDLGQHQAPAPSYSPGRESCHPYHHP